MSNLLNLSIFIFIMIYRLKINHFLVVCLMLFIIKLCTDLCYCCGEQKVLVIITVLKGTSQYYSGN